MTERKPSGTSFESWIDRQIRDAAERGEFDDLPGAGKPLPDSGRQYDENWWIKDKLRREKLAALPTTLVLRKQAEDALAAAAQARSEAEVRGILADINERIREAIRTPLSGPPLDLVPFDADRAVQEWRERRSTST